MEALRNNEEKVICPYNPSHHIRKGRMDVHLKKCRISCKESEVFVICDFNSSHRIPEPELQYHHDVCPDRKALELHVFSEEVMAPPVPIYRPAVPVPVDESWDDEEVPSYDPQKYCEENEILRHLDTESAAKRKNFRIAERHRFSNLDPNTSGNPPAQPLKSSSRRVRNPILPPTPAISHRNFENPPPDVTAMMQRLSVAPKAAVVPKQRK